MLSSLWNGPLFGHNDPGLLGGQFRLPLSFTGVPFSGSLTHTRPLAAPTSRQPTPTAGAPGLWFARFRAQQHSTRLALAAISTGLALVLTRLFWPQFQSTPFLL